jgi:predicted membrane channel-forming protein YqfA (hemolysin III family)
MNPIVGVITSIQAAAASSTTTSRKSGANGRFAVSVWTTSALLILALSMLL